MVHYPHCVHVGGGGGGGVAQHIVINAYAQYYKPDWKMSQFTVVCEVENCWLIRELANSLCKDGTDT